MADENENPPENPPENQNVVGEGDHNRPEDNLMGIVIEDEAIGEGDAGAGAFETIEEVENIPHRPDVKRWEEAPNVLDEMPADVLEFIAKYEEKAEDDAAAMEVAAAGDQKDLSKPPEDKRDDETQGDSSQPSQSN